MSILITGGAGYIGSHTLVALLQLGYDAVVVDNLSNSNETALARVSQITGRDFAFYKADVCDSEALNQIFHAHEITCVIHFAGLKAVGESVGMPLRYYENNLLSTIALAQAMEKHDVKRIIFSSSATVYKAGSEMPLTEESPLGCTNPYGWSKLINERILTDTAHAHPDWSVVLLRYFNPIGAHESGLIGEDPNGVPNNLMPFITQTAVGLRERLSVYGDDYDTPDGTGVRDYIHVTDLAAGHVAAIRYAENFQGVDTFNLGTGRGYSVLEIVRAFEKVNHIQIPYAVGPRRPGDIAQVYSNPEKAEKKLQWRAEKTLEDMCRDAWNWQKLNPHGYIG